jgi:hypothetical protein
MNSYWKKKLLFHPMLCSILPFLNVSVLHYYVFTKPVYNRTASWLLVV